MKDLGKQGLLIKGTGSAKIANYGTVVFIKENVVNSYIRMGYAKAMEMTKCVGKIAVPANPMKLGGNFVLGQRVIPAEINPLGLISIDGFYDVRMRPSLKKL